MNNRTEKCLKVFAETLVAIPVSLVICFIDRAFGNDTSIVVITALAVLMVSKADYD